MLLVWGFFPLTFNNWCLFFFSCRMSWCSYSIAERKIHSTQLSSGDKPALWPSSAEWERQTCLESKIKQKLGLSLTTSILMELSGRWVWDRRLKSSMYPLWIPLSSLLFLWNNHLLSLSQDSWLIGCDEGKNCLCHCFFFFLPALLSTCDLRLYLLPTVQTLLWRQKTHNFPFYLWGESVVQFSLY